MEDITEALWGARVSASTVSDLNQKIYEQIERWRTRPIEGEHPYVFLDGVWLKRSWGGEVQNASVLVALAVNDGLGRCTHSFCPFAALPSPGEFVFSAGQRTNNLSSTMEDR